MKFRIFLIQFLVISFFILLPNMSYSKETLYFVTGNDYKPYTDQSLKGGGLYTKIVRKVLEKLKVDYKIDFFPWARGYNMVKQGKATATFPYVETEDRKQEVIFSSISLFEVPLYLFGRLEDRKKNSIADFNNKTFCSPLGYAIEKPILNMIFNGELKLTSPSSEIECLKAILAKRADVMTINEDYIYMAKQNEQLHIDQLTIIGKPVTVSKLFVIFNMNTPKKLITKFENAASEFIKTAEYKEIIEEYLHN